MQILDELTARGLVENVSDREGLAARLAAGPVTFYGGYDPTAESLHAGNLVPLSIMSRLARAGHKMIAVVGGATGMVGDPSGKTAERKLLDDGTLARNLAALDAQIRRFVSADAVVVNNAEWFGRMGFLEFLRDVGKHMTVNYMLGKESVRARLEDRDQGISYTEFTYMLLQGYDFVWLADHHGCRLQVGGGNQWGNITCGIELYRKTHPASGDTLFGLVGPLLLTASGAKFGKSEKGQQVWLDAARTSPYRFYQYWLNSDDADVGKYLKMFAFIGLDEIAEVMRAHDEDRARRLAQRRLAHEVTVWVHGDEAARRAEAATHVLFGGSMAGLTDADLEPLLADVPATEITGDELFALELPDLLVKVALVASKSEARRLLAQGGVYLNNVRMEAARKLERGDLASESMLLLRAGKKSYHLVRVR